MKSRCFLVRCAITGHRVSRSCTAVTPPLSLLCRIGSKLRVELGHAGEKVKKPWTQRKYKSQINRFLVCGREPCAAGGKAAAGRGVEGGNREEWAAFEAW
jgi:hypothetical protein